MPRLLDLYSGRWGWSRAFAARGWECIGVDLVEPPEVPIGCAFIKADIMGLRFHEGLTWGRHKKPMPCFELYGGPKGYETIGVFDFICASSPCEQFSVHGMKHFHPNPPYPELGIKLFNHTRSLCEASGVPYVMENVRAAQQFVGNAVNHCGPLNLWGSGVPPLMPQGIVKGTRMLPGVQRNKLIAAGADIKRERHLVEQRLNVKLGAKNRKENIAGTATIPPELANAVCDYAERLIEARA